MSKKKKYKVGKKYEIPINRMEDRPDTFLLNLSTDSLTQEQKYFIDGHRHFINKGTLKRSEVARKLNIPRILLNLYLIEGA